MERYTEDFESSLGVLDSTAFLVRLVDTWERCCLSAEKKLKFLERSKTVKMFEYLNILKI